MRILIATDAAREGLNLQCHCWNLFHFDVPWNPSRMEQRNGRIDRKLQPKAEVYCHYFVYKQRAEDRVLEVLIEKTRRIKLELGSLAQVVEGRLANSLRRGIRHADVAELTAEIEATDLEQADKVTVQEELEATRDRREDLKGQVDRLRTQLSYSKEWLGLDEAHFRDAISCALEMMSANPLKAQDKGNSTRFDFPAMDLNAGAGAAWADTMDTLRQPRKRDQKFWEWRKESPIRPVVFEDPGTMDDSVVHLHLEHRVVQRLLSRFNAQGFVHNDLSRACLSQTTDAIPRVILLGRLCLYGPGAARLHEELVPIAARWIEPSRRKGEGLKPLAREAENKALTLLEESLLRKVSKTDSVVEKKLRDSGPRDVEELLPLLEERSRELANEAAAKLAKRGEEEALAMKTILQDQKKRIAETARATDKRDTTTMRLKFDEFDEDETRQIESNKRYWQKRLKTLDADLVTEPARIRELYEVRAQRIEPVGLVYLWPVTG